MDDPIRRWVKDELDWEVEVTSGLSARTWSKVNDEIAVHVRAFEIQARRWVVDRTFGWLNRFRLLSKEYTVRIANAEADIVMLRIMSRRLARLRLTGTPNPVPDDYKPSYPPRWRSVSLPAVDRRELRRLVGSEAPPVHA